MSSDSEVSSDADGIAVGTIKIRPAAQIIYRRRHDAEPIPEYEYYSIWWDLKGKFKDESKEIKSPVFTVPNREECKWYFSVRSLDDGGDIGVVFSTRLHLDFESECEAAVAEFEVTIDDRDLEFGHSCETRTFKFIKRSENSADILSTFPSNPSRGLSIIYRMTVINVIPEDDSFPNDFGSLLKDKRFTDVAICAGPRRKKFLAHKVILSARSSVFAAMFAHNTTENEGVVNIKDIRKEVVEKMLHYIYTGEVEKLDENLAQDLLVAADKYDLKGLKRKCEGVLIENLSRSNAFDLLLFAESYNANKLRFEAIYFIRWNKTELMKTPGWESLGESNPALVRELSEARPSMPESSSNSESE